MRLEDEEAKEAAWEAFYESLPLATAVSNRRNDVIKRYRVNGKDVARVLGAVRLTPKQGDSVYAVLGNSIYKFIPLEGAENSALPVATIKRKS